MIKFFLFKNRPYLSYKNIVVDHVVGKYPDCSAREINIISIKTLFYMVFKNYINNTNYFINMNVYCLYIRI